MHKKLSAELVRLAHQILKIDEDTDIRVLRDKARDIYENLSVLHFIDDYFVETPDVTGDKGEFLQALKNINAANNNNIVFRKPVTEKKKAVKEVAPIIEIEKETITPKTPSSEIKEKKQLEEQTEKVIKKEAKEIVAKITPKKTLSNVSVEKEMQDSIPADVAANMFEKSVPKTEPKQDKVSIDRVKEESIVPELEIKKEVWKKQEVPIKTEEPVKNTHVNVAKKQEVTEKPKKESGTTLNDRISNRKILVGLNDRIAFVKHLFDFSQENFNLVLSRLNNFTTEEECLNYLNDTVKKELDWSEKEEYEERLLVLIAQRFK